MYTVSVKQDLIAQHYLIGGTGARKISPIPTIMR